MSNYNLELFLMSYFGKNINDVSKDEFNNLEYLSLDGIDISASYKRLISNLF